MSSEFYINLYYSSIKLEKQIAHEFQEFIIQTL